MDGLWRIGGSTGDLRSDVCHNRRIVVGCDAGDVLARVAAVARRHGSVGVGYVDVDAPRHP